jgi:preprotein translocase subunit YajC
MLVTPAYAQTAGAAGGTAGGFLSLLPLVLIFVAFYFLMIRPQQRRMKALQDSVNAVKKGDSVVTGGGLVGKVTKVDEKFVELEIAKGVNVRAVKSTLAEVLTAGGAKPAND